MPNRYLLTSVAACIAACPAFAQSIFTNQAPIIANITDGFPYELGTKFKASADGEVTAVRFWKAPGEPATAIHIGTIWSAAGEKLAVAAFSDETNSGWQTAALPCPLRVKAGIGYVVSVNTSGYYVATNNGLATAVVNGLIGSVADGKNGVYGQPGKFPASSWKSSNYFRDVVFKPDVAPEPMPVPTPIPDPTPVPGQAHVGKYTISGKDGLIIDGDTFTASNDVCISISNSKNIMLKNIRAVHCYGVGVSILNSSNITIQTSYFEDLNGGVYAVNSTGIKVTGNRFKNVGRSGKMDNSRGQFVQFNNVTGAGNEIGANRGINIAGQSSPEDLISMFESSGTQASPINVHDNCVQGGGSSTSGGGIMTGDYGGNWQTVQNNTVVNPGQYGIAVASGTNIKLLNNKIFAAKGPVNNIGMYIWNQTSTACSNITVQGNQVDYTNSSGAKNPYWNAGNCGTVAESGNNFNASLSALSCSID